MISNRAEILFKETPPLVVAHFKCAEDPYHPDNNPNGYINFGTAENFLVEKELLDKIAETPALQAKHLHYTYPWGSPELRQSYTSFLKKFLNIQCIDAESVAVGCGLSSIIEILSYSIFNEGDKVLTISPLYNGFYHDFETRFKAKITLSHSLDYQGKLDLNALRQDIERERPRVLLINNPHNPLGYTYSANEVRSIIELAKEYEIKIIADEVYANSDFGEKKFTSFLDPQFEDINYQDSIYHLYGMAKDFALSGFKVGFFASTDKRVTQAVQSVAYFHTVSTQTQHTVTHLINDHQWCSQLFKKNKGRLSESFEILNQKLHDLGIGHFPSESGIFTMIDLSSYLKEKTSEAEMELFNYLIDDLKISITPGQFFGSSELGYFRVCYAKPQKVLLTFLKRLEKIQEFR